MNKEEPLLNFVGFVKQFGTIIVEVVVYVKTNFDGTLKVGNKILMIRTGRHFIVSKLTSKNLIGRRSFRSAPESRVLTMSMSAVLLRLMTRSSEEEALSGSVEPKQIVVSDFYTSSADAETDTRKKHSQTPRSRRRCRFFFGLLHVQRCNCADSISLIWRMQMKSIFTHTPAWVWFILSALIAPWIFMLKNCKAQHLLYSRSCSNFVKQIGAYILHYGLESVPSLESVSSWFMPDWNEQNVEYSASWFRPLIILWASVDIIMGLGCPSARMVVCLANTFQTESIFQTWRTRLLFSLMVKAEYRWKATRES